MADSAAITRALVLLVEDDEDARASCADALRRAEFEVLEAGTRWQARETINARTPDVIVLDLRLPDGNGIAAARAWRKSAALSATPILILTGHSTKADVDSALVAGCEAFLTKPCPADVLVMHIERTLAASRPTRRPSKLF